jgi:hypothetical protein
LGQELTAKLLDPDLDFLDDHVADDEEPLTEPASVTDVAMPHQDEPALLPWRIPAFPLAALGVVLPAVLDPTRTDSAWVRSEASAPVTTTITLGEHEVKVTLVAELGDEEHLRLGRDALAGRVWIAP